MTPATPGVVGAKARQAVLRRRRWRSGSIADPAAGAGGNDVAACRSKCRWRDAVRRAAGRHPVRRQQRPAPRARRPARQGTTPGAAEATAAGSGRGGGTGGQRRRRDDRAALHVPHRSVVEHRHRREGGAPDGGRDRGREPGQRPWRRCRSGLRQRHRAAQRRRHQGHRLRGHRLRGEQPRRGEGGHRSLARVLSWSDQRHLLRRAVERAGDVAVLPRPVAIREGAGAVVHGRQSRDGQRAGVRRRAGHDADLRERRAAVGRRNWADGTRAMRRRTSA